MYNHAVHHRNHLLNKLVWLTLVGNITVSPQSLPIKLCCSDVTVTWINYELFLLARYQLCCVGELCSQTGNFQAPLTSLWLSLWFVSVGLLVGVRVGAAAVE